MCHLLYFEIKIPISHIELHSASFCLCGCEGQMNCAAHLKTKKFPPKVLT